MWLLVCVGPERGSFRAVVTRPVNRLTAEAINATCQHIGGFSIQIIQDKEIYFYSRMTPATRQKWATFLFVTGLSKRELAYFKTL